MKNDQYSCIIVDDEPQAVELLVENLQNINPNINVAGSFTSWSKALEGLRTTTCDILFLDISMQGHNGMDLLRCLPELKCEVIFITAYSDYALDAFRFSTSGYLLKPVSEVELSIAVERAITRCSNKRTALAETDLHHKIGVATNNAINYVEVSAILYLEALNAYTKVYTTEGEMLSSYNLGRFKEMLPCPPFFQVHRSYIVNVNLVKQYKTAGYILIENNKEIPVAKSFRDRFLNIFKVVAGHR